jgi:starch synthase
MDGQKLITKVCRFVAEYPTAGKSSYGLQPVFVNLSEEQVRIGYEVHVIARRSAGQPSNETVNGVEVHRVTNPFNITALDLTIRLTRGERDWVLHPHATSGLFLNLAHRALPTPLVCHSHGTSRSHDVPLALPGVGAEMTRSGSGIAFHMLRERMLWSSADRLLVVSKAVEQDVVEFYGVDRSKIRVVYNGIDAKLFSPSKSGPLPNGMSALAGKRVILFVGHFGVRKGIFYVIRAMKRVRNEFPDAHLLCVGGTPAWLGRNDYRQMLEDEVRRNGVENCVTLLEAVKNTELAEFYRHSEVFVLPTYYEAFPKVVVEAMGCGLPVVATRTGGIPELVADGETGYLTPFGSPEALSARLTTLLGDDQLRVTMGSRGRERVEKEFTWHAVAERTRSAYDELQPN